MITELCGDSTLSDGCEMDLGIGSRQRTAMNQLHGEALQTCSNMIDDGREVNWLMN